MSFSTKVISGKDLSRLPDVSRKQVQELDHRLMDYDWTDTQWQELWESPSNYSLSLLEQEGIQGFSLWMHSDHWELLKIAIDQELRGTGKARSFFEETFKHLKAERIFLEVSARNAAAICFYQKLGFIELNRVKGYYRDGSDCLKMVLNIDFSHNN